MSKVKAERLKVKGKSSKVEADSLKLKDKLLVIAKYEAIAKFANTKGTIQDRRAVPLPVGRQARNEKYLQLTTFSLQLSTYFQPFTFYLLPFTFQL